MGVKACKVRKKFASLFFGYSHMEVFFQLYGCANQSVETFILAMVPHVLTVDPLVPTMGLC